jgi:hypothetical protein
MTATAAPVWGTWKTHGNLSAMVYFGQDRKAPAATGRPVVVGTSGGMLAGLDPDNGSRILYGGPATRFWATPDMVAPSNQPYTGSKHADQSETCECGQADCGECNDGGQLDRPAEDDSNYHEACELDHDEQIAVARSGSSQLDAYPTEDGHAKVVAACDIPVLRSCGCGCGRTPASKKSAYCQGHDARHVSKVVARVLADGRLAAIAELPTEALRDKATNAIRRQLAK